MTPLQVLLLAASAAGSGASFRSVVSYAPWLQELGADDVVSELVAVVRAVEREHAWQPDWQNLTATGSAAADWASLTLLNRGQLDISSCARAPRTCAVLGTLLQRGHLRPRSGSAGAETAETGVRLLRLAPGAALRPHRGPGNRLVAHIGIVLPPDGAASVTVQGERRRFHRRGQILCFDDAQTHHASNEHPTQSRVVLQIAFPIPSAITAPVIAPMPVPASGVASALVVTITSTLFSVEVFANCTARTLLLGDGRRSALQPLLTLYNDHRDNHPSDMDACVAVSAVKEAGDDRRVILRAVADHEYGHIDLLLSSSSSYITIELHDLTAWHADPVERHLQVAMLDDGLFDAARAPFVSGKFQGHRGTEGLESWSAGFFTLSSEWQQYNAFYYAQPGERVAFTAVRTADLPAAWAFLAQAEGLPAPNPNRAVSWYWTLPQFTSEATIGAVIARAKTLGARLIFFLQMTSNIGDFVEDPVRFPSGFRKTADAVRAAGLEVGLHLVSPGAHRVGTVAGNSSSMLELFVPQGVVTRDYNAPTDAGTWWCHEARGDWVWDHTRHPDSNLPPSQQPPPGNAIRLTNTYWSKRGIYRNGSAIGFGGGYDQDGASYGEALHVDEYDFNLTMSLQMTVHIATRNSSGPLLAEQTLAVKPNAWRLYLGADGRANWHVLFADGSSATAVGQTLLTPDDPSRSTGGPWVLKATVAGGVLRLHACSVTDEGQLRHRCRMYEDANASTPGGPALARSKDSISFGASLGAQETRTAFRVCASCFANASESARYWCPNSASLQEWSCQKTNRRTPGSGQLNCYNIDGCDVWAERNPSARAAVGQPNSAVAGSPFTGAIEEIMISKIDTTDWKAMNWNCPATGMVDFYIFDFTNPAARAHWANATSALLNMAHASTSQWDGAEFQPSLAGWDFLHSNQTYNSGLHTLDWGWHPLWGGGALNAFRESQLKWTQQLAVEMSLLAPGFSPWRGDMSPFSDELRLQPSHGGDGMCVGGQRWAGQILYRTHAQGTIFNSYNTPVDTLPNISYVDCFLGALITAGVPPQMFDSGTWPPDNSTAAVARDARIKFWLDHAHNFGHIAENTTTWLHIGRGDGEGAIFAIDFANGENTGAPPARGLYSAAEAWVQLPARSGNDDENVTTVVFVTTDVPSASASFAFGTAATTTARFFAASNVTLQIRGADFFNLANQNVQQQMIAPSGSIHTSFLFTSTVSGKFNITSPPLVVGSTLVWTKVSAQ